ncbi:MAG: alpha-amylase family glycosyl hydrolase [Rhabdochlamydiaceae bacterium]|nr:alpha-amylase family glycosyl hydrolase [Candidatus Amphrikana amoebophyrae]
MKTHIGKKAPLGFYFENGQVNFSIHAPLATTVKLLLFNQEGVQVDSIVMHQTKERWHICLLDSAPTFIYQYELHQNSKKIIIFDPFSPFSTSPTNWGEDAYNKNRVKSIAQQPKPFDWEDVKPPCHKLVDTIFYEMHIRGFTNDPSSRVENRGTFLGAIEKIPHLKELGITTIELLPIQEFNESKLKKPLTEYWGYSTINFFQIMNRYLSSPNQINDLKLFIKTAHQNDIEVVLDVVYNHTGGKSPLLITDPTYYILTKDKKHTNYTGCGNSISANEKHSIELISESLKYLVKEFHIDGFRFDLAATLTRDKKGSPLKKSPLIKTLANDSVLKSVKLISEPWDPGGLYQVGHFPPPFSDWNGWYRDIARKYINGFEVEIKDVQEAILGTPHLFKTKAPYESINFITVHDGFSLLDLVSYETKHNEANNENNQDGSDCNFSKNFGTEGKSKKLDSIRTRQIKNFALFLFCSAGTPLMLMGDEVGMTHEGNNNPWCQDNATNYLRWDQFNNEIFNFFKEVIALRKEHNHFKFHTQEELEAIQFHSQKNSKVLVIQFNSKDKGPLCVAFNPTKQEQKIELPGGHEWEVNLKTHQDNSTLSLTSYSSSLYFSK